MQQSWTRKSTEFRRSLHGLSSQSAMLELSHSLLMSASCRTSSLPLKAHPGAHSICADSLFVMWSQQCQRCPKYSRVPSSRPLTQRVPLHVEWQLPASPLELSIARAPSRDVSTKHRQGANSPVRLCNRNRSYCRRRLITLLTAKTIPHLKSVCRALRLLSFFSDPLAL